MIEPLLPAIEVWLAWYSNMPIAITNLINLTLGLFVFVVMWNIIYHIRGH